MLFRSAGSASINAGLLNLSITATDASGGASSDEFTFTVFGSGANLAPILRARLHDQVAIAGSVFTFTTPPGFIVDPENDSLTYSASLASGEALPAWLTFNAGSQTFSGTPAASDVGKLLIRVTADDGLTHTANDVFLLGVSAMDLETLYLPMTPAGVPAMNDLGEVIRLPAPVPADAHYYLLVKMEVVVPPLPEGSSTFGLKLERDIKLYDGSGNPVTTLSGPISICFKLTDSQWAQYSSLQPSIGTAPDPLFPWTLKDATLYASSHEICATFSHLSLYDLFFRVNDTTRVFKNIKKMPKTGFAAGQVTSLPSQSAQDLYASQGDLSLEIPSLAVRAPILGVPSSADGWNLSWLGGDIGWLEGSAYPTWNGNSVLTGHIYNANGKPGIFVNLDKLRWGDQVIVTLGSLKYTYEVRENLQYVDPSALGRLLVHKESPWLTLVTCQGFDKATGTYRYRIIVRAVLLKVQ